MWDRARPTDVADGILSSGRTVEGVVAWTGYGVLMAAIGVACVVTGTHHPTDILGGAVPGARMFRRRRRG